MESVVNSDFNSWCHLCGSLEASIAVEGDIEQAMIEVSLHVSDRTRSNFRQHIILKNVLASKSTREGLPHLWRIFSSNA